MHRLITAPRLASAALAGVACYVVAVVILAVLHPEMNPLERPISGYLSGRHPVLAATTFFVLAGTFAALNLGLHETLRTDWLAILGHALTWLAVAGIVIAGIFPHAPMHVVGSLMTFPPLSVALVLLSVALGRTPGWERLGVPLLLLALGAAGTFVLGVTVFRGLGLSGLGQRLYFLTLFAWMTVVAWRLRREPGRSARGTWNR